MSEEIILIVNGKPHKVQAEPETALLYVLRNELGLTSPQFGCGEETCGACLVLVGDQRPIGVVGAVNGTVFYGYIEQCVVPTLQPGDILFMDNLSARRVAGLEELIRSRSVHLIFLPPYSADFNPIELACQDHLVSPQGKNVA